MTTHVDSWPADLAGLRAEFERGRTPRDRQGEQLTLIGGGSAQCRACTL